MTCSSCGEHPKNTSKDFTKAVIEINNPESLVLFRKVVIPASLGDEQSVPPVVGKYHNVLLHYEASNKSYLYSSDGIPTLMSTDIPQEVWDTLDELQTEIDDLKNSPDVVDIVATYATLQSYDTSRLGDNDVIRVLSDETHNGASTYYRWNATTQSWTYIGEVGDYYTKGQVDALLNSKQNTLTAGENITITNNVISAKGGLFLVRASETTSQSPIPEGSDLQDYAGQTGLYVNDVYSDPSIPGVGNVYYVYNIGVDSETEDPIAEYELITNLQETWVAINDIDSRMPLGGYGAPDSSIQGQIGQLYVDVQNHALYMCTDDTSPYVWQQIGGGEEKTIIYANYDLGNMAESTIVSQLYYKDSNNTQRMTDGDLYDAIDSGNAILRVTYGDYVFQGNMASYFLNDDRGFNTGEFVMKSTGSPDGDSYILNIAGTSGVSTTNGYTYKKTLGGGGGGSQGTILYSSYNFYKSADFSDSITLYHDQALANAVTADELSSIEEPITISSTPNSDYTYELTFIGRLVDNDGGSITNTFFLSRPSVRFFVNIVTSYGDTSTSLSMNGIMLSSGGGPTVVQTTGTSTADVMSQNATTSMVFADPNQKRQVRIGNTNTTGSQAVSIGFGGLASGVGAIQIGSATASGNRAIAIGADANSSYDGSVSIGQEAQVYRYGTGVAVGKYAMANADATTAIGAGFSNQSGTGTRVNAQATGSTAIGYVAGTTNSAQGSVALGAYSLANRVGEVNVGSTIPQYGFNLTNYRVIGGVHDGQLANDAATKGQLDTAVANMPQITMQTTDPGEGATLGENEYIGVYGEDPLVMDYSTSEVSTGAKWIDGSMIYKKTVNFGALPNASSKTVAHSISNLGRFIKVETVVRNNTSSATHMADATFYNGTNLEEFYATDTQIQCLTQGDRSAFSAYVTLYYTKSS